MSDREGNLGVPRRGTVDCGDDRYFDVEQVPQEVFAFPVHLIPLLGGIPWTRSGRDSGAAEFVTGPGKNDDLIVAITADIRKSVFELL
jgi:hypothetical protein